MLTAAWNIWLALAPWILLGAAVSGVLHVLLPENWLRKKLSGRAGVLRAVALGVPLPLCSCGVIPVGLGMKKDGAGNGAAVGFLISTPQTGVDSILVSASFLGWPFAALKVVVALVTGLVGGLLAEDGAHPEPVRTESGARQSRQVSIRKAFEHSAELIRSIWGWLVIGVIVSAALTWLLPAEQLAAWPALTGPASLFLALLISVPLYVCATASIPIAAALVAAGLSPGAALVFLMAGPATNIATMGAVYRTLGRRSFIVYLFAITIGSLGAGLLFNRVIPIDAETLQPHFHSGWWQTLSGVVLLVITGVFAIQEAARAVRGSRAESEEETTTIAVNGMTCDGCAGRLERALEQVESVTRADASWQQNSVAISGAVSAAELHAVIQEAGFEVVSTESKNLHAIN